MDIRVDKLQLPRGAVAAYEPLRPGYLPIIVEHDGTVVDGYHRVAAAIESRKDYVRAIVVTPRELVRASRMGRDGAEWIEWVQERMGY